MQPGFGKIGVRDFYFLSYSTYRSTLAKHDFIRRSFRTVCSSTGERRRLIVIGVTVSVRARLFDNPRIHSWRARFGSVVGSSTTVFVRIEALARTFARNDPVAIFDCQGAWADGVEVEDASGFRAIVLAIRAFDKGAWNRSHLDR